MTRQLTLNGMGSEDNGSGGRIIPTALHEEMQRSYLEYAMSVIVGRALPDVRDGLKPVHRRILYAMHELGLTPDRPYRKCARVVGDVLGKYHPHGDQAVYDALVRMVQDFSSRYPLLSGHGNFGSVDDDPPAAMRYTECRLSGIGNEGLLSEIGEDIVEFTANFDGSQQEPTVLPARLPLLLLNGSSGIAVGMATNVPPHNLGELVDGLLALIDQPELTVAELMKRIPGPDFPTAGEIVGREGIVEAYTRGRGSITVRGVAAFEEIQPGKGRHRRSAIIITEFPFQVNKAAWIEKVAELVNQDRIPDIVDLRDESDRTGIRVVVEVRREANPQTVLNQLFKYTPLQTTFGVTLLTLVNGEPQQIGLKETLQQFLTFRITTLTRIFTSELGKVQRKAEEVSGMLLALDNLDAVIDLLRRAPDGTTAKQQMIETLNCTATQADTILAMPLRRLTGLERSRLQEEHATLTQRIQELQGLLQDRQKLLAYLKKELRGLKKHYGDPRRTRLNLEEAATIADADLMNDQAVLVQLTQKGYARRQSATGRQSRLAQLSGDDWVVQTLSAQLSQTLLTFTPSGKVFPVKVQAIPAGTGSSRGVPLATLISSQEPILATFVQSEAFLQHDLILLTQEGRIKRIHLNELHDLSARGSTLIKCKDDDQLGWIELCPAQPQLMSVVVATVRGRILRIALDEDQMPVMGRAAMGNGVMRMGKQDQLAGLALVTADQSLLMVTAQGTIKGIRVSALPLRERGSVGIQMPFQSPADHVVGLAGIPAGGELGLLTTSGRVLRQLVTDISIQDHRSGPGRLVVPLEAGDQVSQLLSL